MAEANVERRLAAILAADVVGCSRLMEANEERTMAALKHHRREFFDPTMAKHGGRIFKVMGDGFLVEFGSVLNAARCAVEIQRAEACGDDDDARFIFLWIAFNAAYADEREFQTVAPGERAAFVEYFGKLVALDGGRRIYNALWQRFSGPVRMLMENRYVFNPFWQHHNGIDGSPIGKIASKSRPAPLLRRSSQVTQPRC